MKKYYKISAVILLGFFASKVSFLAGMYPLGVSLLTVVCFSKNFYYVFVGSLLGALTIGNGFSDSLINTLPYALSLPLIMIFRKYKKDGLYYKMAVALISFLLPAFFLQIPFFQKVTLLFSGLFSICLIPLVKRLYITYSEISSRLSFEQADVLALSVIGGLTVSSLPNFSFLGFNLPIWALLFSSSVALKAFEIRGSIWTTVAGIIFVVKGGDLLSALCLMTGGVLGGIFAKKKGGIVLGFILGDLMISIFTLNTFILSLKAVNILLGCGFTFFLKEDFIHRIRRFAGMESGVNDLEMEYIEGLKGKQKRTIENSARMYLQLSRVFMERSLDDDFKESIVQDARTVCENCKKREYCLKNRKSDTLIELKDAVKGFDHGDTITALPLTLTARCVQPIALICAMNDSYQKHRKFKDENPSKEYELSAQLKNLSDMLFSLAEEVSELPQFDKELENQVRDIIQARIGTLRRVSCRKRGDSHIIELSVKENKKNTPDRIISALNDGFLGKYRLISGSTDKKGGFSGTFAPMPRFNVNTVALREKKNDQAVCGDSFTFFDAENDRYIAAISDGAGHGEKAQKESESTLELLEAFSEAGVKRKEMFKTMNQLMLLKGEKEDYSTVDVAEFDLESGVLYWTKIGAVPGYILRNGKVEKIEAEALPMGIVTKIDPVTTKKLILENDVIVLVSDGVYDGLNSGNIDKISHILKSAEDRTPETLAKTILSEAKKTEVNDDMTVMVMHIKSNVA